MNHKLKKKLRFKMRDFFGTVRQLFIYDTKRLFHDFYHGKKRTRVCLEFRVTNEIITIKSPKTLQKCFGESTLSRTQEFEW